MKILEPREALILWHRFAIDPPMTLESIARKLAVTRERVRQLENIGRSKLRRAFNARLREIDENYEERVAWIDGLIRAESAGLDFETIAKESRKAKKEWAALRAEREKARRKEEAKEARRLKKEAAAARKEAKRQDKLHERAWKELCRQREAQRQTTDPVVRWMLGLDERLTRAGGEIYYRQGER
jgi:hypothetical protein